MREIILLGSGPTHGECPFDREVWGVNYVVTYLEFQERGNKLFFFDDMATFNPHVMTVANLWVAKDEVEFITSQKNVEFLKKYFIKATPYPLKEIITKFKSNYFANTICYMIAYAMYEGVDKISLYGIDHINYREYMIARCGTEYWLGRAQQAGVDIEIAGGSAILKTVTGKLYGYEFFYNENTRPEEKFIV